MHKFSLKSQALIFVVITFLVSWAIQVITIKVGASQNSIWGFALMWTPGIVALICSVLFGCRLKDLAFKLPDFKSLTIAYIVPAVSAVVVVGLLLLFGICDFEISPSAIEKKGTVASLLMAALLIAPTVGMIVPFVSGLGEEIGWRGFLHSKLVNLNPNRRYLLTGIIWSAWHWPLIMFGEYATSDKPWLSAILFTIVQCSFSFLIGLLRDRSKSVFPAALAHASHNMWFLGLSPIFLKSSSLMPYFAGESGVFCAATYLAIAITIARWQRHSANT